MDNQGPPKVRDLALLWANCHRVIHARSPWLTPHELPAFREPGNPSQARHRYQQAISTGHPEVTKRAQRELRALNRPQEDRQRGEHFGRYGYLAYANPTLMKQDNQRSETPESTTADHAPRPDGNGAD